MNEYTVCKREVWIQYVTIKAESENDAKIKVSHGEGIEHDNTLEYSHDMSVEYWTVDETEPG